MVGERDREQDAVRWDLEDTAAISIPPPFNNGVLQYNQLQLQQHQRYAAAMAAAAAGQHDDILGSTGLGDLAGRWDDEQNYAAGLMGDSFGATSGEKGVRFPESSPTSHAGFGGFSNGQLLSQAPLQRAHSR